MLCYNFFHSLLLLLHFPTVQKWNSCGICLGNCLSALCLPSNALSAWPYAICHKTASFHGNLTSLGSRSWQLSTWSTHTSGWQKDHPWESGQIGWQWIAIYGYSQTRLDEEGVAECTQWCWSNSRSGYQGTSLCQISALRIDSGLSEQAGVEAGSWIRICYYINMHNVLRSSVNLTCS